MNLSKALAEFVTQLDYNRLPENVSTISKRSLIDAYGVILAASTLGEGCHPFIQLAKVSGGTEDSTILGYGYRVPAPMAAFANGAMSHALDFEDTHDASFVHSNAVVIPAALAVAEANGPVSGKELISAIIAGSELVCRLGLSLKVDLLEYGWYMPPILSAFGAAAAAGKLLNLTSEQMLDAFSLVQCQSSCSAELTQNPQSVIRSVRDAFAAQAGVTSALLAKEGITGFTQPFEGKRGFFHAYTRGNYDPDVLLNGLGENYEAANISFKLWPSCRGTHPYIEGVLQLMNEHKIKPNDVTQMKAIVSPVNRMLCEPLEAKQAPTTSINAKFSIPFTMAVALTNGKVGLGDFVPEALQRPDVLQTASKVQCEVDQHLSYKDTLSGYVEIHTRDQIFSTYVKEPYGNPKNPISDELLVKKFFDCAKYSHHPALEKNLHEFCEMIFHLEEVTDVRQITRCLYP